MHVSQRPSFKSNRKPLEASAKATKTEKQENGLKGGGRLWRKLYILQLLTCVSLPTAIYFFFSQYDQGGVSDLTSLIFMATIISSALLGISSIYSISRIKLPARGASPEGGYKS